MQESGSAPLEPSTQPRMVRHFAVLPAAGVGSRMGADRPKQYLDLNGQTVLEHSVAALSQQADLTCILVVVGPQDDFAQSLLKPADGRVLISPVGGASRRDSVRNGLLHLRDHHAAHSDDWIWVHDAARPGLDRDSLKRLRDALDEEPCGVLLALPVVDTVKRVGISPEGEPSRSVRVEATLPRERLWLAQTPQVFRLGPLLEALDRHPDSTDEASAMEADGHAPRVVPGDRRNLKVTTMDDLHALRVAMETRPAFRMGQGWDVHALVPGRALVIGGVTIPFDRGLLGHSDADVLLHAITDALLGAAGLGDIGRHFPDSDPRFAGADSRVLLREALSRVRSGGWEPVNLDSTVVAQSPRLAQYIPTMVGLIAADLELDVHQVNVKAKTSEKLGFAGRGEGIEAHAIVMIARTRA